MDQFAKGDLEVPCDGLDLARSLGGDLLKERIERLLYERSLHMCPIGHAAVARDRCAVRSERELGEVGWLTDCKRVGCLGLDDKESPAHRIAATVLHRRAEGIEAHRCLGLEIEKDRAPLEVIADSLDD